MTRSTSSGIFLSSAQAFGEMDAHVKVNCPGQVLQWLASAAGAFEFVAPAWGAFTGQDGGGELGEGWLASVHPEDGPDLKAEFATAAAAGKGFRRRFRLRRQDGVFCWMLMEAMGRPGGFIGFCLPIAACEPCESENGLAEHRLADLLEHSRLAAVAIDLEGRVRFANASLLKLLGRAASEVLERNFFDAFVLSGPQLDGSGQVTDYPIEFETEILDGGEGRRLLLWHTIVLRTNSGHVKGVVLVGDDITIKRQAEQRFLLTHKVFETTEMAMIITDAEVRIIAANSSFTRLTGYAAAEAVGRNPRLLQSDRHDQAFYQRMWSSIVSTGHWHGEIWDRRKDGSLYPKFLSISTIKDEGGNVTNYCGIFYDISERKSIEEKLDRMAHYDALTDLPNRILLHERLEQAVAAAARAGTKVALLYLDLDHFKEVNDSVGHDVGDLLLQQVAHRLQHCVRSYDTVARLGGDEFVVLLVNLKDTGGVNVVAEKVLRAIAAPFKLNGQEFRVSTSIGISLCPDDHHQFDILLKNADQAMYRAKAGGRAGYKFFGELGG